MILSIVVLALVTLQRIGELVYASRNTRRLLDMGGVESGAAHYPVIVGLHGAWLAGLWWLAWDRPAQPLLLILYVAAQAFRIWTMTTLGPRWTTRIITLPGETPVRRGPYRFLRHPNYVVVAVEIALLPLVFGLVAYAIVFSALNASVLWVRIRAEQAAWRASQASSI